MKLLPEEDGPPTAPGKREAVARKPQNTHERRANRGRTSKTFDPHKLKFRATDEELAELDQDAGVPLFRAQCENEQRPCPYVSCRYHLGLEVTHKPDAEPTDVTAVRLKVTFKDLFNPHTGEFDLEAMQETCALDVAAQGDHTLEEVGELLGMTRERIRQVEENAKAKFVAAMAQLGIDVSDMFESADVDDGD